MLAQENFARGDELNGLERLGLRVSAMINSPLAQFGRKIVIHQLETDSDQDWAEMMELLAETEGLDMRSCGARSAVLCWVLPAGIDQVEALASDLDAINERGGGAKKPN